MKFKDFFRDREFSCILMFVVEIVAIIARVVKVEIVVK